ncbi:hypothetical protein B0H34DRAFT_726724 [Crassisporium funariophilum]|nr:hypothetical protein B0H34DRAFT_726724 [Crassisporium funariophilum]
MGSTLILAIQSSTHTSHLPSENMSAPSIAESARNRLNNACQFMHNGKTPVYESTHTGPQHDRVWTSIVYVEGIEYGRGSGRGQDSAREAAAVAALAEMERQYGRSF